MNVDDRMTTPIVLAATDLREASDEAIRQAHEWARQRNARLAVCHIVPRLVGSELLFPQVLQRQAIDQATFEARMAEVVRRRTEALTGRSPDEFDVVVDSGAADSGILRHASEVGAALVAVGSHGEAGVTHIFLGDVAARVARDARCPVLVARPHKATRWIVVGTDLSKAADWALRFAIEEARLRNARLAVATSIERYLRQVSWMAEFGAVGNFVEGEYQEERTKIERQLCQTLQREHIDGHVEVTDAGPAAVIMEAASRFDAELVVVGAVGAGWLERVRLGRVAEKIIRHAPCSVLVARAPAT